MISFDTNVWTSPIAISIALCATLCVIIYRYFNSNANSNEFFWKDRGVKDVYDRTFSRLGKEAYRVEHELVLKGGKLFGTHVFGRPAFYCAEPELIRDILVKDFHIFTNRTNYKADNPIYDLSIPMQRNDQWKRVRSIVSPTFTTGKLRRMKPLIDDCIETMINNFENVIESGNSECDVKKIFNAFSMDVMISVAFGTKINSLNDEDNPIIKYAKINTNRDSSYINMLKLIIIFGFPKLAKFIKLNHFDSIRKAGEFFTEFTKKIVAERKKNLKNVKRYDFLQIILEATQENGSDTSDDVTSDNVTSDNVTSDNVTSKPELENASFEEIKFVTHNKTLSPEELTAQCVLFLSGGNDTTAGALSHAAYNMALNPEAQEKLYDEAKKAIESNTEIGYDVVHSLKYLDAFIWESFRVNPAITALPRETGDDYTLNNTGITVPKGVIIFIPIYSMHHDPENFPDPESFKPERFFPENRVHHQYAYLPFGSGPRHCIAMRLALFEMKMAIVHTVYRFKFSLSSNTDIPLKYHIGIPEIIPRRVILKVEKR